MPFYVEYITYEKRAKGHYCVTARETQNDQESLILNLKNKGCLIVDAYYQEIGGYPDGME